jgi:multiple antibiotic resistance protein
MSLESLFLCFVPLLVASDPIGAVPVYVALTEGLSGPERGRVTRQSLVTAALVGAVFLFAGRPLFNLLNITVEDFKIAGGLVLLVLAILELVREAGPITHLEPAMIGVVPLGVPLISGPAVLTTLIILKDQQGVVPTGLAFLAIVAIVGLAFSYADTLLRVLGPAGTKGLSKVTALVLAAIAVMMIRVGIEGVARLP